VPHFTIKPTDRSRPPVQVDAVDGAAVLHRICRQHCHEAEVYRDKEYVFSVRLGENGVWTVFQRQEGGRPRPPAPGSAI
jgi:hypothetical protein